MAWQPENGIGIGESQALAEKQGEKRRIIQAGEKRTAASIVIKRHRRRRMLRRASLSLSARWRALRLVRHRLLRSAARAAWHCTAASQRALRRHRNGVSGGGGGINGGSRNLGENIAGAEKRRRNHQRQHRRERRKIGSAKIAAMKMQLVSASAIMAKIGSGGENRASGNRRNNLAKIEMAWRHGIEISAAGGESEDGEKCRARCASAKAACEKRNTAGGI